jgi:hypothetical protein
MPENAENKDPLADEPFDYRIFKNGNVSISWRDKEVTVLKGESARKFLARVQNADAHEAQMAMAKATGNFKRGNERLAKLKGK